MKRFLITILTFCSFCLIYSQDNRSSKFKICESKDSYFYLPISSDNDSTSGIIYPFVNPYERRKSKEILISWQSYCRDGSYLLTITPEQIYLTSSHENPNPNVLYWIIPINLKSYSIINNGVKKRWFKKRLAEICKDTYNIEKHYLTNTQDSISDSVIDKCVFLREDVSRKVINLISDLFANKYPSILNEKKIIPNNVIYFGSNEDEILEWMPN